MADEEIVYNSVDNVIPAFEGAAYTYREGLRGLWEGSADELAQRELRFLQNRSAHLLRNNGYAQTAKKRWITNADHIKVIWKNKDGSLHTLMQAYWDEFAESPSYDGIGNYKVLQGISNASIFTTGNSYIRKLIVRDGNSNTVPLKLQLIPSALHDVMYNTAVPVPSNVVVRYGMKFRNSIPTDYYFSKGKLEADIYTAAFNHTIVPADELVHTFIRDEPGQWLGVPLLASVIMSMYALDDLVTGTISKQQASASLAVIIEQTANTLSMLPTGAHTIVNQTDYVEDGKKKVVFKNNPRESQTLYLNKGEAAKMFQGADIGTNFTSLIVTELRKIAATLDLAYHELTGDATGLNFSSLIGIANQTRNRLEYLHNFLFIPLREVPITKAFKDLAVLYNSKTSSAIPYFQLPRWRGMDDLKDAQADLLELQNGLALYTEVLAERGITMEQVLADLELRQSLKEYGIELTSAASVDSMRQTNNTQANSNTSGT